jgi:hypothetical protein
MPAAALTDVLLVDDLGGETLQLDGDLDVASARRAALLLRGPAVLAGRQLAAHERDELRHLPGRDRRRSGELDHGAPGPQDERVKTVDGLEEGQTGEHGALGRAPRRDDVRAHDDPASARGLDGARERRGVRSRRPRHDVRRPVPRDDGDALRPGPPERLVARKEDHLPRVTQVEVPLVQVLECALVAAQVKGEHRQAHAEEHPARETNPRQQTALGMLASGFRHG